MLKLLGSFLSPLLLIGITNASFIDSRNTHLSIHLFIIEANGIVTLSPQCFRIFGPMPSIPQYLLASNLSSKGVM